MSSRRKEFALFVLVGGLSTGTQYVVLVALVQLLHVAPVPASVAALVAGAIVNYLLNYQLTFRSTVPHGVALMRFTLMACAGAALNTAIFWVLLHKAGFHYIVAQVFATAVVLVFNYFVGRLWTFRSHASAPQAVP